MHINISARVNTQLSKRKNAHIRTCIEKKNFAFIHRTKKIHEQTRIRMQQRAGAEEWKPSTWLSIARACCSKSIASLLSSGSSPRMTLTLSILLALFATSVQVLMILLFVSPLNKRVTPSMATWMPPIMISWVLAAALFDG